jgi:iron complex transport system ATP-binding protein
MSAEEGTRVSAIALDGVSVSLGGQRVVRDVSLGVDAGHWVALIGPNGAGKTTLLRAIAGLVAHDGAVVIEGDAARGLSRRERARRVALVPQEPEIPPWLTVGEYVLLGRAPYLDAFAREGPADRQAAARALERLDLRDLGDRLLGTLSGGEKQRAVVARALAQEARIVLLDEPTAALDIGHQQQTLELLEQLRVESGLTLVSAIHDLTVAALYADRVVLLDGGELVADGVPGEVLTESTLAARYGARVRVVDVDGVPAVVPARFRR